MMTVLDLIPETFEVTANVTANDLTRNQTQTAKSRKERCFTCPLASALLRKLRRMGFDWVAVSGQGIYAGVGEPEGDPTYYLTTAAVEPLKYSYFSPMTDEISVFISEADMRHINITPCKFTISFERHHANAA